MLARVAELTPDLLGYAVGIKITPLRFAPAFQGATSFAYSRVRCADEGRKDNAPLIEIRAAEKQSVPREQGECRVPELRRRRLWKSCRKQVPRLYRRRRSTKLRAAGAVCISGWRVTPSRSSPPRLGEPPGFPPASVGERYCQPADAVQARGLARAPGRVRSLVEGNGFQLPASKTVTPLEDPPRSDAGNTACR